MGYLELDVDDAGALAGPQLEALLEHELGHMLGMNGYFISLNRQHRHANWCLSRRQCN